MRWWFWNIVSIYNYHTVRSIWALFIISHFMKMFNFFHIPVKLISRLVQNGPLAPTAFDINHFSTWYTRSSNQLVPMVDPPHSPKLLSDLPYIKGSCFVKKQFSIDSFLDWEGHHRVFTRSHIPMPTLSSDHSTKHTTMKSYRTNIFSTRQNKRIGNSNQRTLLWCDFYSHFMTLKN